MLPKFLHRMLSGFLHEDEKAEKFLDSKKEVRENLDKRIEEVTKATLNGESNWFMRVVKDNPECAVEVLKECDLKND